MVKFEELLLDQHHQGELCTLVEGLRKMKQLMMLLFPQQVETA